MSYIDKKLKNILADNITYYNYKLCYIDSIPETIFDWDEESKIIINSNQFSWENKELVCKLKSEEIPNPNFIPGEQEFFAFFTPLDLDTQWGDDWNDTPYEHNSGIPYDHGNDIKDKVDILVIPFYVPENYSRFPNHGTINSTFSVKDINDGAIPWIFIRKGKNKTVINAGIEPLNFCKLIDVWKNI